MHVILTAQQCIEWPGRRLSSLLRHAHSTLQVKELVADVIPTRPSRLSFSQLQNFIGEIAIERGYSHYFWGHADVALMATNATTTHSAEVLGLASCLISYLYILWALQLL